MSLKKVFENKKKNVCSDIQLKNMKNKKTQYYKTSQIPPMKISSKDLLQTVGRELKKASKQIIYDV